MLRLLHSFLFGSRMCSGCGHHWVASSTLCRDCHAKLSAFLSARKKGRNLEPLEAPQSFPSCGADHSPLGFQGSKQMSMSGMQ